MLTANITWRRIVWTAGLCAIGAQGGCGTMGHGHGDGRVTQLEGADDARASTAIPAMRYAPRSEDFADDHPDAPGLALSFNTLHVIFQPTAAVGEVNALLRSLNAEIVGGVPGTPELAGIVQIRVPAASHAELKPFHAALMANPLVKVVAPEVLLTPQFVPDDGAAAPAGWTWESQPSGGNWGMELSRVPQMWNLNSALAKLGRSTTTAVLDADFDLEHADLALTEVASEANPALADESGRQHGTHVSGTVAARVGNSAGVDGVNPFARVVVKRMIGVLDFIDLEEAHPDVRVLNISVGLGLVANGLDPGGAFVNGVLDSVGAVVAARIALAGEDTLPLLVVAAGNDSGGTFGTVDAVVSSPYANAARVHGAGNIIVVENVAQCDACTGGAVRSGSSCVGGDVSAPGSAVLSTFPGNNYGTLSGTSMASPFVAGLVSYLFAVEPSLTHAQVKDLLAANAVAVDDGTARVDAWATVMDIDRITGDTRVLRMLLDIDDGTLDGNTRKEHGVAEDFLSEDADQDGGPGDGRIDMADFRRWRDWLLQVENDGSLDLDGSPGHPKRDVNGNGSVEAAAAEGVYPRGDFNGDGKLSRDAKSAVPGAIAVTAVDVNKTDLEVLKSIFDDPHYSHTELDDLIESADIEVFPFNCLQHESVQTVVTTVHDVDGLEVGSHTHTIEASRRIFTVPVRNPTYTLRLEARDAGGEVVFRDETEIDVTLGGDFSWDPAVCRALELEIVFAPVFEPGEPMPLVVRVGEVQEDNSLQYLAGIDVDVAITSGTVNPPGGFTDADGFFTAEVTPQQQAENVTLFITATNEAGFTVTETVTAQPASGPVTVSRRFSRLWAVAVFMEGAEGVRGENRIIPFTGEGRFNQSTTARDGGTQGVTTQDSELTIDPVLGLTGARVSGTVHAENSGDGAGSEFSIRAESSSDFEVSFIVPPGSYYQYTATGSIQFDEAGPYIFATYVGPFGMDFTRKEVMIGEPYTTTSADLADNRLLGPGQHSITLDVFTSVFLGETALVKDGSFEFEFTLVPAEPPIQ